MTIHISISLLGAVALLLCAAAITALYFYDRHVRKNRMRYASLIEGLDGRQIPSMSFDGPFHPGA